MKTKENLAQDLCDFIRKRFFSIYQTELHFWMNTLTSKGSYYWKDGKIECEMDYTNSPQYFTEHGWDHMKNESDFLPTNWHDPRPDACLFNIPEDAHPDFLDECHGFVLDVIKIDIKWYVDYVSNYFIGQGYTEQGTKDCIKRSVEGLIACKALITNLQVKERIERIISERYTKAIPKVKKGIEVGDEVRSLSGEEKAKVVRMFKLHGSHDSFYLCCELDKEIRGFNVWKKIDLVLV